MSRQISQPEFDVPPGLLEVAPGVRMPEGLLRWSFARSGGPGGQNVNKLETKAELRVGLEDLPVPERVKSRLRTIAGKRVIGTEEYVDIEGKVRFRGGELVLTSETHRSQGRNKGECLDKLRELLVAALAEPKIRRKTKPSRSSIKKRIEGKRHRGDMKRGRRGDHE
jgi:ribosome-associated protein